MVVNLNHLEKDFSQIWLLTIHESFLYKKDTSIFFKPPWNLLIVFAFVAKIFHLGILKKRVVTSTREFFGAKIPKICHIFFKTKLKSPHLDYRFLQSLIDL